MTDLGGMDGAELARHLRDPEGPAGLAVIGGLAAVNDEGSKATLELLGLEGGMTVLELGCGLGDLVERVIGAGEVVRYAGVDRSETMIAAALERHREPIASGLATFHLGTSEDLPFAPESFDRVFSLGLIHFWTDPAESLAEVKRVMRPGARMVMGCLDSERPPPFATAENGFLLRSADTWQALCNAAGFASCEVLIADHPERARGMLVIAQS